MLWANAAREETLRAAYVQMADHLQLPERTEQEQEKVVGAVLHWLATHEGWLLVVDNADELEMVWPLLPTGSTGHLLLTTRDPVVGGMEPFHVASMKMGDGSRLLLRRAGRLKKEEDLTQIAVGEQEAATQLVAELGGLPLALDQAGAYIEETQCSVQIYRTLYQTQRKKLLARRGRRACDYPESVATTWLLSFRQVEAANPLAVELLRLCAFLAPDAIPDDLVREGLRSRGWFAQFVLLHQKLSVTEETINDAVAILRDYSLITRDADGKTISIHRLVQAVVQDALPMWEGKKWKRRVICAVGCSFPDVQDVEQWGACERWLPHGLVCASWIEHAHLHIPEAARLLNKMGFYLWGRGRYLEVESLLVRELEIIEEQLGGRHPETAISLNNLALLYQAQGKYGEAEPLMVRALEITEEQLGERHHQTAISLNNLAELYRMQGKDKEAELLLMRALETTEEQLGERHHQTAASLNNLGLLYRSQRKDKEAESLYVRALEIYEEQLGGRHPSTATGLNNLAGLYRDQGKHKEAEPLYVRALEIREEQLGGRHPLTAISLNNLAGLYQEQGKDAEAEPLYKRALEIREEQLGERHPQTAESLNNLAELYRAQGKYVEAEPLLVRALEITEEQLGGKHPSTARSLNNLAGLYQAQRKYVEAESLYKRALSILEENLGKMHPHSVVVRKNYGILLRAMGRKNDARALSKSKESDKK